MTKSNTKTILKDKKFLDFYYQFVSSYSKGWTAFNSIHDHNMTNLERYSFIYSLLSLPSFSPMCVSLCLLSPFIFCLQSSSRFTNVWTASKYSRLRSAFLSFFGQSKPNQKPFQRRQLNKWWSALPHTMIAQNILTLLIYVPTFISI